MQEEKQQSANCLETNLIRIGQEPERWPINISVPPISMSTTFRQAKPGITGRYEYSRVGNPTRTCLEDCLASIENAKYALTFSSSLAAATTLMFRFHAGDHIISNDDIFSGTEQLLKYVNQMGIECSFIDMVLDPQLIVQHLRAETKLIWIETPTNPLLRLVDIQQICKIVHEYNPNILVLVDSTNISSYFQHPIELGADLVLHSLTKYMNGHSDVVMGCLVMNTEELHAELSHLQYIVGAVPSPFDCYLVNRGLKTLSVRMKQHMTSTLLIAEHFQTNKHIERIIYPPLQSFPQYELYQKQMSGFSGLISIFIKTDRLELIENFLSHLKLFTKAASVGGYQSSVEHPRTMSYENVSNERCQQLGITNSLIRLSIGLENVQDLINDIENALESTFS